MICFYHSNDLDGHCSGAIVKTAHPACEMIGYNYGDEFPWDKVKDQDVWLVDVSLQPFSDMLKLKEVARNVTLIDHHVTLIDSLKEAGVPFEGVQVVGLAGCELTWDVVFPGVPLPRAVYLLGRYDVWDHAADSDVMPFQHGAKGYETHPTNDAAVDLWKQWFTLFPSQVLAEGKAIGQYITSANKADMSSGAFDSSLDGLHCLALNRQPANS